MSSGSNRVDIFDLETYPNAWICGIKNFRSKKVINLEVSEEFDDRDKIYEFFSKYDGYLIGFNSINYDEMMIKYFLKEFKFLRKCSKKDFLESMKSFSDKLIDNENNRDYLKKYFYQEITWTSIDLFLFWSKMLRISKKISLKSLGIQLNYSVVMELPYSDKTVLNLEQLQHVREYNNIHDLCITDLLAEKLKPEITLRRNIRQDYELNCLSWDAPKIASEVLLQDYCSQTGKNPVEVRRMKFFPYTGTIGNLLKEIPFSFKNEQLQKVYGEILSSDRNFSKEFAFISGKTSLIISLGIGGIHSLMENKIYKPEKGKIIESSDVESLYPTEIINHDICRFPEVLEKYKTIKVERVISKKNKEKIKDTFYKLILNS